MGEHLREKAARWKGFTGCALKTLHLDKHLFPLLLSEPTTRNANSEPTINHLQAVPFFPKTSSNFTQPYQRLHQPCMLTASWKCKVKLRRKSRLQITDVQNKEHHATQSFGLCAKMFSVYGLYLCKKWEAHLELLKDRWWPVEEKRWPLFIGHILFCSKTHKECTGYTGYWALRKPQTSHENHVSLLMLFAKLFSCSASDPLCIYFPCYYSSQQK